MSILEKNSTLYVLKKVMWWPGAGLPGEVVWMG